MGRAAFFAGIALLALTGADGAMAVTARAPVRVLIIESNVVRINWTLAMPSVRTGAGGAVFSTATPSTTLGPQLLPGNAAAVRRADGPVPLTAPASFEVVRGRGEDLVLVRTAPDTAVSVARDGVIAEGALPGSAAASIEVAREGAATPMAGRPSLSVVVQYN